MIRVSFDENVLHVSSGEKLVIHPTAENGFYVVEDVAKPEPEAPAKRKSGGRPRKVKDQAAPAATDQTSFDTSKL